VRSSVNCAALIAGARSSAILDATLRQLCQTPEQYKAWSQNLGYEGVLTTFTSYGEVEAHRQAEIIRALGRADMGHGDPVQELIRAVNRVASLSGHT